MITMRRKGAIGFPLYEAIVGLGLVAVFAVVLLDRILYYSELGERTAVELTLAHMRSGLRLTQAKAIVAGRRLGDLPGSNPMRLLADPPENYLGEGETVAPSAIEPGHWIFERSSGVLYYRPRNSKHLSTPEQNGVTFLKFVLISNQRSSATSEDTNIPIDVVLTAAPPYRWFD